MKASPQMMVYLVGIVGLGLFYEPIKSALGGKWVFLLAATAYLVVLRLIGSWIARSMATRGQDRRA